MGALIIRIVVSNANYHVTYEARESCLGCSFVFFWFRARVLGSGFMADAEFRL